MAEDAVQHDLAYAEAFDPDHRRQLAYVDMKIEEREELLYVDQWRGGTQECWAVIELKLLKAIRARLEKVEPE